MGIGNFVGKMAVINADAEIGNNNVINTKALIEHECKVVITIIYQQILS